MHVIRENTIRPLSRSSVVTVGNFDGVHRGHLAVVNRCIERAEAGQDVVVTTFEPLPQAYFSPEHAPARLSSSKQKIQLLEQSGIDLVWMMRFNQELADMSAGSFAETVLSKSLAATHVVVGSDFRFGRAREGDLELLGEYGDRLGFTVEALEDFEVGSMRISSSEIRQALAVGRLDDAAKYLGRPFTMSGVVIQGQQLGRELGYPTANMMLEAEPSPLAGIFAVQARIGGHETWLNAVASLGNRPAVGGTGFLVEVHIFDFSEDLYDQELEVRFVSKIRDEQNFDSLEKLVNRMKKDEALAREVLNAKEQ